METFTATILAKGAPVKTSDGEIVMCAIAVSDEIGLVRLYPLTISDGVRVWSVVKIKARQSTKDSRHESWRVIECETVGQLSDSDTKFELLESCVLMSGYVDPITYQNEARNSIAIVKTHNRLGAGLWSRIATDYHEFDNEETWVMTQDNYPYKPYLVWTSIQGSEHKTHLVAQEVYVGMAKNSSNPFRIFENMNICDPDYHHWLVLGNMKDRRNVWVCPHLHRLKKTGLATRSSLHQLFGRSDGWPYLKQEGQNAKCANPQSTFAFITDDT